MYKHQSETRLTSKALFLKQKIENVNQEYAFVFCDSIDLLRLSQRLRHAVYCKECNWEPETQDEYEEDDYDITSLHYLVFEKASMKAVATFRIIVGNQLPVSNMRVLPQHHQSHPSKAEQDSACEISRFSIAAGHRNRALIEALMIYAAARAFGEGYTSVYTIMEHSFAKKLARVHISSSQLTDTFEYFGTRAIYLFSPADILPILAAITAVGFNKTWHEQDCELAQTEIPKGPSLQHCA